MRKRHTKWTLVIISNIFIIAACSANHPITIEVYKDKVVMNNVIFYKVLPKDCKASNVKREDIENALKIKPSRKEKYFTTIRYTYDKHGIYIEEIDGIIVTILICLNSKKVNHVNYTRHSFTGSLKIFDVIVDNHFSIDSAAVFFPYLSVDQNRYNEINEGYQTAMRYFELLGGTDITIGFEENKEASNLHISCPNLFNCR